MPIVIATALSSDQLRKLDRIKNYKTRYELIVTDGEARFLVCYMSSRSMSSVVKAARERLDGIIRTTGDVPLVGKDAEYLPGEWRVVFSGRTQREAIIGGELRFVNERV
jgi:hypothetical protein